MINGPGGQEEVSQEQRLKPWAQNPPGSAVLIPHAVTPGFSAAGSKAEGVAYVCMGVMICVI